MKFRRAKTGEIKTLKLERITIVALTNVDDWFDTYAPGFDDKLLQVVEATPTELTALRRAGFKIKRAADNVALRRRGKRARANAKKRATTLAEANRPESMERKRAA